MKPLLILIASLSFTFTAFGQFQGMSAGQDFPDSGFANKIEAKNGWVNGLKSGKWVQYYKIHKGIEVETPNTDAPMYRLTVYKTGKPYGIMRQYYKSGKIQSETPFEEGKQNGMAKKYYENGKIFLETPFTDGIMSGVRRIFSELGDTILIETISEDKDYGVIKTYYSAGKVKIECPFVNRKSNGLGKINFEAYGVIQAYHNQRFTSPSSVSGEVNGVLRMYFMNGKVEAETVFSDGALNGTDVEYYEDGHLKAKRIYQNDAMVGKQKNYDETGFEIGK